MNKRRRNARAPRWVGPFAKTDGHMIGVDTYGRAFAVAVHGSRVEVIAWPDPPPLDDAPVPATKRRTRTAPK